MDGGGEKKGIAGIVVGTEVGMEGRGGSVSFGRVGIVGIGIDGTWVLGKGGNVAPGKAGSVGSEAAGRGGSVTLGSVGMVGIVGKVAGGLIFCKRCLAPRLMSRLVSSKSTKNEVGIFRRRCDKLCTSVYLLMLRSKTLNGYL